MTTPVQTLVRVTVHGAGQRVDLALPGVVPVVEMVADLTRSLGMGHTESRLVVTTTGAVLDPRLGLLAQGVGDGTVLTVAPVREYLPPEVHDDVVEAVHELSRDAFAPWDRAGAESAATRFSGLLLSLGALVLTTGGGSRSGEGPAIAGLVAAAGALALLIAATRAGRSRVGPGPEGSGAPAGSDGSGGRDVVCAWFACLYAAVAGALLVTHRSWGSDLPGDSQAVTLAPQTAAALAALATAGVALVLLGRRGLLVVPVMVVSAAVAGVGLLEAVDLVNAHHCFVAITTVWILGARMAPGLVMESTALRPRPVPDQGRSASGPAAAGAGGVDLGRLRTDLHSVHDLVLGISLVGVGLLLVALPSALANGWSGLLWLLTLVGVTALRLRRMRLRAHVGVGLAGVALVVSIAAGWSALLQPVLPTVMAVVLLAAGVVVGMLEGGVRSVRTGWLADRAEVLSAAASIPLALLATVPSLLPGA